MTDTSWERLRGGPCDGQPVWVEPGCWAVIVTRDSERGRWLRHVVEVHGEKPLVVAEEAHLYMRLLGQDGFIHTPNGLDRYTRGGEPAWALRPDPPGEPT